MPGQAEPRAEMEENQSRKTVFGGRLYYQDTKHFDLPLFVAHHIVEKHILHYQREYFLSTLPNGSSFALPSSCTVTKLVV